MKNTPFATQDSLLRSPLASVYFLSSLFCLLFLNSCKTTKISEATKKETVTIKLIQVNDVYEIAPLSGGKYGGMARVAHISDSIKRQFSNSYLVMAGDFLNPSLLGTLKVDGKRVKGRQMIEVMNAMNFDLATFGNHEFDIKENELQERLNESTFEWVSANVFQKNGDDVRVFHTIKEGDSLPIRETVFYDIDIGKEAPIRVGFFGVTIDSNPKDFVYYSDFMLEARSAVSSLKQAQSDIIIGLTHLKVDQDREVAEALPSIDFIMGGHEHNNMLVPTKGATIAKADANAKTVYVHTLIYDIASESLAIESELVAITNAVPSLPKVQAVVDRWDVILEREIKTVVKDPNEIIYHATIPLDGTDTPNRSKQTNLGAIITQAMAQSFDTPVAAAIVNGGSFRLDDMLEGDVVSLDIFRVLPFGGDVLKVDLTGQLLHEVLNFGESKSGTGAYLQRYGCIQKEGTWLINNVPIDMTKIYTVAFSDFLLKGFDIPFLTPDNPGVKNIYKPTAFEDAYDIRSAVINYMKTL